MILRPFTFAQASDICRDYQYLCDQIMDKDAFGKGYVECVAVAPFDPAKKWLFAQFYREHRDPEKALRFYKGPEYDVILLSTPLLRKRNIFFLDLYSYAQGHQILFDPADYLRYGELQSAHILPAG